MVVCWSGDGCHCRTQRSVYRCLDHALRIRSDSGSTGQPPLPTPCTTNPVTIAEVEYHHLNYQALWWELDASFDGADHVDPLVDMHQQGPKRLLPDMNMQSAAVKVGRMPLLLVMVLPLR